tara:strand:+ start:371 stop:1000 length:630 start_codon:yes stop_codon:yes gene_type:complete
MNITKKRLMQIIAEECGAMMNDIKPNAQTQMAGNVTITGSPDHEISMAYKQLNKAAKYSQSLAARMQNMPEANLPGWVQAKITKASDYISMVYHYLEEELDDGHDADTAITLEKQPINEMFDSMMDPESLMAAGAGIFFLYKMLTGRNTNDPEEALKRVRQEIEEKYIRANMNPPDDADERQAAYDRKLKLRRWKQQRDMQKGIMDDVG